LDDEDDDNRITRNLFLRTRAVCKFWKFGVDTFFQNHPSRYSIGVDGKPVEKSSDKSRSYRDPSRLYHYEFKSLGKVDKFIATFSAETNPFINRCVLYKHRDDRSTNSTIRNDVARYREAFTNVVQLYGSHIGNAELVIILEHTKTAAVENSKLIRIYNMIQQYLSLMPDLKVLEINLNMHPGFQYLHRDNPSIRQLLVTNPLSKLEHLITFKMIGLSPALWNGLLEANSHVRSFSVDTHDRYNGVGSLPDYLTSVKLDSLQEFAVTLVDEEDFNTLKSLSWIALKALVIRCRFTELDSVFEIISECTFAPTLKRLILFPPLDNKNLGSDILVSTKLELPQLETLKMIVPIGIHNVLTMLTFFYLDALH